jgi:hypothetical protein
MKMTIDSALFTPRRILLYIFFSLGNNSSNQFKHFFCISFQRANASSEAFGTSPEKPFPKAEKPLEAILMPPGFSEQFRRFIALFFVLLLFRSKRTVPKRNLRSILIDSFNSNRVYLVFARRAKNKL